MTRRLVVALVSVLALAGCSSDKFDPGSGSSKDGGVESGTGGGASGSGGSGATGGSAGQAGGAGTAGTAGTGGGSGGNPGGDPNGTACTDGSTCKSSLCVDDVCCDSLCDKACQACNVSGSEGTCTPYAQGTDPDAECLGGASSGPCSGSCNGASACEYPDTSCGSPTCTGSTQTNPTCDGNGACGSATVPCSPYVCGASTCKTSCSADADCTSGNWCNGTKCEPKKANGQSCGGNNQCTSSFCVSGVCCNTSCGSPATCGDGTCKCNGVVCASGQSCTYWYQDSDGDTFGNASKTTVACSGTKPSGYVSNKTDCYDANADAKPGQTQFFTTHRGDNNFDYNCDNTITKQYPLVNLSTCGACKSSNGVGGCLAGCTGGFGCNGTCPSSGPAEGFTSDVACGTTAALAACTNTAAYPGCSTATVGAGQTAQGCR